MFTLALIAVLGFLAFQVHGCFFTRNEVIGTYTPRHYRNNYDTLQLRADGRYRRKVYDHDHRQLLDMENTWRFEKNQELHLNAFYLNLDDDLIRFPEKVLDTNMHIQTSLERRRFTITFQVRERDDRYTYYRVGE